MKPRPARTTPRRAVLRRWLAGRTLRGRLIAGLLVVFALASAGVGVVTTIELHRFLLTQLDQRLSAAQRLSSGAEYEGQAGGPDGSGDGNGHDGYRPPPGQPAGTLVAKLTRGGLAGASVLRAGQGLVPVPMSGADVEVLRQVPVDNQPCTRRLAKLGDYRLIANYAAAGDVQITGLPQGAVDQTVERLEVIGAIVFGAALLIVGLAGAGWIRLSLRPLGRITATAAEVARLPLASGQVDLPHRVPDANPRTEVGQLGEAFNQMLGHVEQSLAKRQASEARLRQFIADASHELRTPLAGIRGYTELALRSSESLDRELRQALRRVDAESARMSSLVDDLLLLARLDAGRPLAHDQVDFTRMAIDATNDARVAGPRHRWVLDLPGEPVMVTGDEHRLHQVLANLLTNARTHTPPGTTVTVRVVCADSGDGKGGVELTVRDDGPGVPPELQETVWQRFTRGDSARSRTAGSTGLGLAIVAAVAAAHRGKVSLTSHPGRTTFRIWLPQ